MAIASVGTASGQIVAADAARSAAFIQNPTNSAGTVWIAPTGGAAAMAAGSIELPPGSFYVHRGPGAVTGIAAVATNITVIPNY